MGLVSNDNNIKDLSERWSTIHRNVLKKLKLEKKANKDAKDALEIEKFLRLLKSYNPTSTNIIQQHLDQQAIDIINESLILLNKDRSKKPLTKIDLFHRTHQSVNAIYGGDDIFEEELAAVITTIQNKGTVQNGTVSIQDKLQGSQAVNVKLENQVVSPLVQEIMNQLKEKINKECTKAERNALYTKPVARSGKTDVKGTTLDITATIRDEWKERFNLFQNKTFSVKNYSSLGSLKEIHLGNSDYFKAVYATLNSAGYGQKYIENIFRRSLLVQDHSSEAKNIKAHMYHARFIYELRGEGLYDQDGTPISGTDFFIYNDPSSDNIYVRSTAKIILDYLNKIKEYDYMYPNMEIRKTYFTKSPKK